MSYNKPFSDLLAQAFGVTGSVLPKEGAAPREFFGVTFWIKPFVPGERRARKLTLRVMCRCPRCGRELSASRLKQHAFTLSCAKQAGLLPKDATMATVLEARTRYAAESMTKDELRRAVNMGYRFTVEEADRPENA